MEFLFWISGVITTISVIGCIYFYNRNESPKLKSENESLKKELEIVRSTLSSHFSFKRKAKYVWDGWYLKDDPNKNWSVTFELSELMQSEDGTKIKFEILNVISERREDNKRDFDFYKQEFIRSTGGGWLEKDNKKLTFVTNLSKSEERNLKLKSILGDDTE